jgi:hypothetical protein
MAGARARARRRDTQGNDPPPWGAALPPVPTVAPLDNKTGHLSHDTNTSINDVMLAVQSTREALIENKNEWPPCGLDDAFNLVGEFLKSKDPEQCLTGKQQHAYNKLHWYLNNPEWKAREILVDLTISAILCLLSALVPPFVKPAKDEMVEERQFEAPENRPYVAKSDHRGIYEHFGKSFMQLKDIAEKFADAMDRLTEKNVEVRKQLTLQQKLEISQMFANTQEDVTFIQFIRLQQEDRLHRMWSMQRDMEYQNQTLANCHILECGDDSVCGAFVEAVITDGLACPQRSTRAKACQDVRNKIAIYRMGPYFDGVNFSSDGAQTEIRQSPLESGSSPAFDVRVSHRQYQINDTYRKMLLNNGMLDGIGNTNHQLNDESEWELAPLSHGPFEGETKEAQAARQVYPALEPGPLGVKREELERYLERVTVAYRGWVEMSRTSSQVFQTVEREENDEENEWAVIAILFKRRVHIYQQTPTTGTDQSAHVFEHYASYGDSAHPPVCISLSMQPGGVDRHFHAIVGTDDVLPEPKFAGGPFFCMSVEPDPVGTLPTSSSTELVEFKYPPGRWVVERDALQDMNAWLPRNAPKPLPAAAAYNKFDGDPDGDPDEGSVATWLTNVRGNIRER